MFSYSCIQARGGWVRRGILPERGPGRPSEPLRLALTLGVGFITRTCSLEGIPSMLDPQELLFRLVVTLVPLILAIAVHEFAHVAMARWLGDDTGTRLGRFTLNPIAHIDPVWTVGLPALLVIMSAGSGGALPFFAAGKPAPYNPARLHREFGGKRITLRTAELLVAAAGPLSNVLLALLSAVLAVVLVQLGFSLEARSVVWLVVMFFSLNIALAVFNLIPIPPLDGSKVLLALLPHDAARKYDEVATKLSWVLLGAVLLTGGFIIAPVVGFAHSLLFSLLL